MGPYGLNRMSEDLAWEYAFANLAAHKRTLVRRAVRRSYSERAGIRRRATA